VELQTVVVGASASLESRAWAKLFIFDGPHLLAGRWCVPFRQLPFEDAEGTNIDSVQACAVHSILVAYMCCMRNICLLVRSKYLN